ncbi:hypothetical protein GCM10023215_41720 [Pseudonocardia yuanmonensis]|uniref:diacylglycerol O-acyltransferase n=1 Tax=Pseudonocardia yuanmonensis TaxID=1095914 RepID=A0ABP8X349_9PSEU
MGVRRLSLGELATVWVDEPSAPFQIALVGVFDAGPLRRTDGTVDTERVRAELARRAQRVPALRRRVVVPGRGRGRPFWVDDADPEPERQVGVVSLPPGEEFLSWSAQQIVRPLGVRGALWRAEVVDGLGEDLFGLIVVVHHVLADGLAGVALATSLLDTGADVEDPPRVTRPPTRGPAEGGGGPPEEAAVRARSITGRVRTGLSRIAHAAGDLRTRAPVTSLSLLTGSERHLAAVRRPLEDLRSAGHRWGVTVNDLLLAAVTSGLRELLLCRGDPLPAAGLRASVPVGSRGSGQPTGILLVDLPVAEPDPLRRLADIRDSTARLKGRLRSGGGDVLVVLHLPLPLARRAVRWMRRVGGRRINLFVTNVPGPTGPLWLAGARLLEACPVAPLIRGLALDVAALSYAGTLHVGINAAGEVSDLDVVAAEMEHSFTALVHAAQAGRRLPAAPDPRLPLAHAREVIENSVEIGRDPATVFAFMTDPRHEPDWNPRLLAVEQLTPAPIGAGTRFRMRFGLGVGESTVTYVDFEAPRRWTATSTSRHLDVHLEGLVHPAGSGSRLVLRTRLRPRGPLRPLAPLLRHHLQRAWTRNLDAVRSQLDRETGDDHASRSGVRKPVRQHP